jgi:hypothetical protein
MEILYEQMKRYLIEKSSKYKEETFENQPFFEGYISRYWVDFEKYKIEDDIISKIDLEMIDFNQEIRKPIIKKVTLSFYSSLIFVKEILNRADGLYGILAKIEYENYGLINYLSLLNNLDGLYPILKDKKIDLYLFFLNEDLSMNVFKNLYNYENVLRFVEANVALFYSESKTLSGLISLDDWILQEMAEYKYLLEDFTECILDLKIGAKGKAIIKIPKAAVNGFEMPYYGFNLIDLESKQGIPMGFIMESPNIDSEGKVCTGSLDSKNLINYYVLQIANFNNGFSPKRISHYWREYVALLKVVGSKILDEFISNLRDKEKIDNKQ